MASFCDMAYTWDANKNKTSESITGVMSGYGFTAAGTTYDNEDLCFSSSLPPPASILLIDIDANGTADVNFQYDALGRRVARSGTGGSVVYVQMDQQTIADYPVGGAATTPTFRYVYASYIDEPVVRKTAGTGGTLVYFHRNHQYSVTAITTSTGAIAERYAYTAYGQPTVLDASGATLQTSNFSLRTSYTGREWDATLGLHHFRARWMSPTAGRFLSRDPIEFKGGSWNLYQMVSAKPLFQIDPSGTSDNSDAEGLKECERLKKVFENSVPQECRKFKVKIYCKKCDNKSKRGSARCYGIDKNRIEVAICYNIDQDFAQTFRHEFQHVKDMCKCGCLQFEKRDDGIPSEPNPDYFFNNLGLEVRTTCQSGECDGNPDAERRKCVKDIIVESYIKYYDCPATIIEQVMTSCYVKEGEDMPDFPGPLKTGK